MTIAPSPWIHCLQPNHLAKMRLFCFPYAGGSASIFRNWSISNTIEICAVQLPGRETRFREPAFKRLNLLIPVLSQALLPLLDRPFAFFGHSMGGLVSFEVARYLRYHYELNPLQLIVSGAKAPQLPDLEPPIHTLPQAEFIQEIQRLNGTPIEVLHNAELMELVLPTLRADFELIETYQYYPAPRLSCPIAVFGGSDDPKVQFDDLKAWQDQTIADFLVQILSGDHFFLNTQRSQLLHSISDILNRVVLDAKLS
jgi:medium-chain acyl-[acyl-carrier-protein] hydrolase